MGASVSNDLHRHRELLAQLDRATAQQHHLVDVILNAKQQQQQNASSSSDESSPGHRHIPRGSCCYVWKQDPSVARIGIRKVYLPHNVRAGPSDDDLQVVLRIDTASGIGAENDTKATALAMPDGNQDFFADIDGDPFCFDLVHVYTVARMTLDMYIRDLKIDWRWNWELQQPTAGVVARSPLRLICHAGERPNAVYHRGKRVIKFYYFSEGTTTTYLCRSFDIVAHETGHAILDAIKPKLYGVHEGQSGALHESFGDLTAIFAVLDQLDMCEDVISETKGDLRKARNLTAIGEQFADAMKGNGATTAATSSAPPSTTQEGTTTAPYVRSAAEKDHQEHAEVLGMRDANNVITGKTASPFDLYQLANVFTGFVFDCLVDMFAWERDPQKEASDAATLHRVARSLRRMLLLALHGASETPDFMELAHGMAVAAAVVGRYDVGDVQQYKRIVLENATKRCLPDAGVKDRRRKDDVSLDI